MKKKQKEEIKINKKESVEKSYCFPWFNITIKIDTV